MQYVRRLAQPLLFRWPKEIKPARSGKRRNPEFLTLNLATQNKSSAKEVKKKPGSGKEMKKELDRSLPSRWKAGPTATKGKRRIDCNQKKPRKAREETQ